MRDITAILALVGSGQASSLTDDEAKAFRSYLRSEGVITASTAPKLDPDHFLADLLASDSDDDRELAGDIKDIVSRVSDRLKKSEYLLLAFDSRGHGNARLVEIWRKDPDTDKNVRVDEWPGSKGYPSVDLLKD